MRIITGTSKGRKLATRKSQALRPTSDRVKESMFDILGAEVQGKVVLDLYAGTGNLGMEALSRGAKRALFVEKGRQALRLIQRNLSECGMRDRADLLPRDVLRAIGILKEREACFDLILMDPPYAKGLIHRTLMKLRASPIYHQGSILVVEHDRREPIPEQPEGWNLIRQRRIGDSVLSFLTPASPRDGGNKENPGGPTSPEGDGANPEPIL